MTNEEREQILKGIELAWSFPSHLKKRVHARAKMLGMSDNDFIIQSVEEALGGQACTVANFQAAKEAIKERLIGENYPH